MRGSFPCIWNVPITAEGLTAGRERRRRPTRSNFHKLSATAKAAGAGASSRPIFVNKTRH